MLELTQSFMIPLVRLQNSLKWPLENTPHVGQMQIADSDLLLPPLRMCLNRSLQAPPLPSPIIRSAFCLTLIFSSVPKIRLRTRNRPRH